MEMEMRGKKIDLKETQTSGTHGQEAANSDESSKQVRNRTDGQ
jgi:hypothetical protein